jgi:dipeptidyl-peptidase-4
VLPTSSDLPCREVLRSLALGLLCSGTAAVASPAVAAQGPTAADYAAANQLLPGNLQDLVKNASVQPHWIGESGRFWYRRDGASGPELLLVSPQGKKSPAFDHAAVGRALAALTGGTAGAGLPESLKNAALSADLLHLTGAIDTKTIDCDLKKSACRYSEVPAVDPARLASPDGRRQAFTRGDNLWVRDAQTGAERQLTTDGAAFYSWAKIPDSMLTTIVRQKSGMAALPFHAHWSPDSRYIVAPRVDERRAAVEPFVEWVPTDGTRRAILHEVRSSIVGDRDTMKLDFFVIDLDTGRQVPITLPAGYEPGTLELLGWSRARGQVFLLARTIGSKSVSVFRLEVATGDLTRILEETSATRVEVNTVEYHQSNIRLVGDGAELVWYSARSGSGHLYLYDAQTGRFKNEITRGDWQVHDILAVDEKRREIYLTGGGREPGRDPYYRHLYRASLDGRADVRLLTEPDADHHFTTGVSQSFSAIFKIPPPLSQLQPAAGVFLDTYSTVDKPPVSVLRSTHDGHVIAELEHADASRLYAAGWRAPVRERVKAADGKTDLYTDYYAPYGVPAGAKVPVIDAAYGGPQVIVTPRNFIEAYLSANPLGASSLARLGFAVFTVDGRGTPTRSSAFRDAGYTEFTQVGIDDHIATMRELAQRHPQMDVSRAGVSGWSWGGTFAAQAILSRPESYHAAVSGAGVYDYAALYPGFEAFTGIPAYADGTRYRTHADEYPANWEKLDITRLAGRLQGHLLIIYGDADENVPAIQAFRLVDALTRANKPYDLVYLPNRTHGGMTDGYTLKRTWDYFIERLMGAQPVPDVAVKMRAIAPSF